MLLAFTTDGQFTNLKFLVGIVHVFSVAKMRFAVIEFLKVVALSFSFSFKNSKLEVALIPVITLIYRTVDLLPYFNVTS